MLLHDAVVVWLRNCAEVHSRYGTGGRTTRIDILSRIQEAIFHLHVHIQREPALLLPLLVTDDDDAWRRTKAVAVTHPHLADKGDESERMVARRVTLVIQMGAPGGQGLSNGLRVLILSPPLDL
jgi:hypothetical protein